MTSTATEATNRRFQLPSLLLVGAGLALLAAVATTPLWTRPEETVRTWWILAAVSLVLLATAIDLVFRSRRMRARSSVQDEWAPRRHRPVDFDRPWKEKGGGVS